MIEAFRRYGALALVLAAFGTCLTMAPASAEPSEQNATETAEVAEIAAASRAGRMRTVPGVSTKAPTTSWTTAEPQNRACFKARRKFWQDGEGWIVKTTTICP